MPRPSSLSLDLLQTFQLLVENEGDAARTAQTIGINQASMSKRLKHLQHAGPLLDRPWLEREGKTWRLTEEGKRVLPAVEEILARYEKLTQFIAQPSERQVHFACGQHAVQGFVRQAIRGFRRQHPDVRLRMTTLRGAARIERVANGTLDLATVTHDEPDIHRIARRKLHVEALLEDRMMLVSAENVPWSSAFRRLPKTKVSAASMADFPLILPDPDSGVRRWLDAVLREQGILADLDIVLETGGWSTILSYIRDGLGVGILPSSVAESAKPLLLRRLSPTTFPPRVTRLICRELHSSEHPLDLTAEADAFRQSLLGAVR